MKKYFKFFLITIFSVFLYSCSSQVTENTSFEDYIKTTDFNDFEYDEENDIYIVSTELNTIIDDENAINGFNDSIYDVIHSGVKPDKDVVFRGWDGTITASLVYFNKDTFDSYSSTVFNSTETYSKSDGWYTISRFGQYLTSNDYAATTDIEEMLFYLSMLSNK